MMRSERENRFFSVILCLIWPFLAAASSILNYKESWSKNIFWLFCIFYGLTFSIGAESEGSDIVRYVAEYQELHKQEMTVQLARDYYAESGEIDIVRTLIAVTLSRFTDSQAALTLVYATIFGFFFSRNLWYVMERLEGKWFWATILLLICFFLINPIWRLNTFRMWTAAHIFLYGLLPFLLEGRKRGIWISGLSLFFHFSYLFPFMILLFVVFSGKWLSAYFSFFMVTIFMSEIDLTVINNIIESYAPEIFQERTSSYRIEEGVPREETVSGSVEERQWYARWYGRALRYSVLILLISMFVIHRDEIRNNKGLLSLFCYVLVFYAMSNLLGSISSSGRFVTLANLFALPLIIFFIQNQANTHGMRKIVWILSPALFLFVIVALRRGLYTLSETSILGNPIIAYFMYGDYMSLNDFLKSLL